MHSSSLVSPGSFHALALSYSPVSPFSIHSNVRWHLAKLHRETKRVPRLHSTFLADRAQHCCSLVCQKFAQKVQVVVSIFFKGITILSQVEVIEHCCNAPTGKLRWLRLRKDRNLRRYLCLCIYRSLHLIRLPFLTAAAPLHVDCKCFGSFSSGLVLAKFRTLNGALCRISLGEMNVTRLTVDAFVTSRRMTTITGQVQLDAVQFSG